MKLDKTDSTLLNILQDDASMHFVNIAKKIGITDGAIHQRIRKLRKSGVIKRFTIQINPKMIGFNSTAYVLTTVDPGFIESVSKEVIKHQNILEVHEVHTQGDLLIKIRASSQEEIRNTIVNVIRKIKGVRDSETLNVYRIWKEENRLPLRN
jgi:Lrp/AsnC family transcriptional regulator for asnA, asnC and gidA